ncbi:MAG: polysaccharide deacetylase family protein [Clostridia bacterium]|nr:polysaccharide deacetylase family protein [Clostridia bacterium]
MRFASVCSAFITALLSLLLLFGCIKEKNTMDNMGNFEDVRTKIEEFNEDITELESELASLTEDRAEVAEKLRIAEKRAGYKKNPTAFLTFDEGFTSVTVSVVNQLNEAGVKATFFVIGKNLANNTEMQEALKAASDAGHAIGIRSYSGDMSEIYKNETAYFEDLYKCRDLIKQITGKDAVLVRMPGGSATAEYRFKKNTGSNDCFKAVLARLIAEGFIVNDWTVDTGDATVSNVDTIVSNTLKKAQTPLKNESKTCVILFTNNNRTTKALPSIIEGLKTLGYAFETMPVEFAIVRQR